MGTTGLVTSLLLVLLEDVRAELCSNSFMFCEHGCCGNTCCTDNIPVIVGSTVGGVAFIVILIISICVYLKKGNKADRTIGVDPSMLATTALAAQQFGYSPQQVGFSPQQAGYSPQMALPFEYSASPHLPLHYGMQPLTNPLLSYPRPANIPPPYLLPANQSPPNPASANPAAVSHPPPNPPSDNPAPPNPPPQQVPSADET